MSPGLGLVDPGLQWPCDPLDILKVAEHESAAYSMGREREYLQLFSTAPPAATGMNIWAESPPSPQSLTASSLLLADLTSNEDWSSSLELNERLANLDAVVRELSADVAGLCGAGKQKGRFHKI